METNTQAYGAGLARGRGSARMGRGARSGRACVAASFLATVVAAVTVSRSAWAAGGGGADLQTFQTVLVLVGVLGAAYVVTHIAVERLERRFGFVTGVEYLVLGALTGPVLGWIAGETFSLLRPALTLGTGAIGLLAGLQVRLRLREPEDRKGMWVALWVSAATVFTVFGVPWLALRTWLGAEALSAWIPGLACATAVALVADPGPVRTLNAFLEARGVAGTVAARAAGYASALAILAAGVLFDLDVRVVHVRGWDLGWQGWFALQIAIGGLLGLLFTTFLKRDLEREHLLTIVIGMVIFTSGLAAWVGISPLFMNFLVGLTLRLTLRDDQNVESMLSSTRRPFYIVLFFFAGVAWDPSVVWWAYALAIPWLALRVAGRWTGGFVAAQSQRWPSPGMALLAPGGLSIALMVDFRLGNPGVASAIAYSALLLGVLASEWLSYRWTRRWLIDAADVPASRLDARPDLHTLEAS